MAKAKREIEGEPEWRPAVRSGRDVKRSTKIGAYLSEDAAKRLKTAVLVEGLDQSVILDALIRTYLVGYYSGMRGGKDGEGEAGAPVKLVG
jgi:hypothetical protein